MTTVTKESFGASFKVCFKPEELQKCNVSCEVGVCYSEVNSNPTINDGCVQIGTWLGSRSFVLYGLDAGTTYFYRPYVKVNDAIIYGDVLEETTFGNKQASKIINGHKFIDLGLPSGLLWAEMNLGAQNEADAACVNWKAPCRMPRKDDFTELLDSENCDWIWSCRTSSAGKTVNGYLVISRKNGNTIFFRRNQ